MENSRFGLRYQPHFLDTSMVYTRLLRKRGDGAIPHIRGGMEFDDDAAFLTRCEMENEKPQRVGLEPDFLEMVRELQRKEMLADINYLGILDFDASELDRAGYTVDSAVTGTIEGMRRDVERLIKRASLPNRPHDFMGKNRITVGFCLQDIDPDEFNACLKMRTEGEESIAQPLQAQPVNLLTTNGLRFRQKSMHPNNQLLKMNY